MAMPERRPYARTSFHGQPSEAEAAGDDATDVMLRTLFKTPEPIT